ncbi:MAG: proliferating cell nuclear antigen (pcna) [Candidatus Lokiarchaeota archaeon]|nr:proliferating cell nuclear antigen (pcna) [Candidatus Lokiarchaeota archaeon]
MSFTLKLENSRILKGIVETLASIIDETEFRVTPKEFTISAMDPSRICLLKLSIKKDDFDEYECSTESKIGLNLDDLDKILKRSTTNDTVEINFTETDQKIKIKMQREGVSRTRTFSLALLDIDIEEIPMDNLLKIEYDSKWVIDTDFLVEAIKDAEIYSEILNINANEGKGLIFSSSGQIGEMEYDLNEDDLIESQLKGSSSGAYSLTFLKAILKIASITEKLEISLKTDHPLKMNFDLLEGGKLSYFLAPRVEEEEFAEDDDMDEF